MTTGPERFTAQPGRLDVVTTALTGLGRADVQRAIAAGQVTVDGQHWPKSHRLSGGESIEVDIPSIAELAPEGPPVPIRYADDHILVIAKPAGLISHPTASRRAGTLVNRLLGMEVPLSSVGGPLRPGIVHRLDAGTSGLMLVALNDDAHRELAAMMKRHDVERLYLALVRGVVEHDNFAVDAPLGRRADRVVVDRTEGRDAETVFDVQERFEGATLLQAAPRTGRTHQIRVHLQAIDHPILGDRAYGGTGDLARTLGLERPFLHSASVAFDHPMTGERVEVTEPLPQDLEEALQKARALDADGG
ncbi:MAG TPA: RluA family pseudouridine synthase [Actinomycetota bacterium]